MISFTYYDISWITIRGLELVTKPSRWMVVRTAQSQRFLYSEPLAVTYVTALEYEYKNLSWSTS